MRQEEKERELSSGRRRFLLTPGKLLRQRRGREGGKERKKERKKEGRKD